MPTITLINQTDEVVRLAIFKRPVINPTLSSVAWRVAEPPPGGSQVIEIPDAFQIFAQYSDDPHDPSNTSVRTNMVTFAETTAIFGIDPIESQDGRSTGAQIHQSFDGLVLDEVRVFNRFGLGCVVSICQDGDPLYGPQVVWPGGVFFEDVRGGFFVSVVSQVTSSGQRLITEEISLTQVQVLEGGSITVTGSMWKGYALTVA
jgi:hypothetical protein